jgi:diacylglycerol kinase family enzyme
VDVFGVARSGPDPVHPVATVEPLEFDRLLVTRNPASTNARDGQRMLRLLSEAFPGRLHELETHEDELTNTQRVAELLHEGDVVVPFGGDSTVTQAAGAIILRPDLLKVSLAPLPLGHANQMAFMLNAPRSYRRPANILRRGQTVPVYPLQFVSEDGEGVPGRLALFTIGIGLTGISAARLDTQAFRSRLLNRIPVLKKFPEARVVLRGLRESRPFLKDGQHRIEVLVANGRRVAKHGRFAVELPEHAFAVLELADKRPATLAPVLGRFVMQLTQPAERLTNQLLEFTVESIDAEPIIGQRDGQPFVVNPGRVAIRHADRPVYVVTTRRSIFEGAWSSAGILGDFGTGTNH